MDEPKIDPREEPPVQGNGLAALAGTWTHEEFVQFEDAIAVLDSMAMAAEIDEELGR
ncbi:MAG TPA: hypothetical protein VLQ45_14930 [Thermoanaerobaculia bacterium]|nr:hypothetical protein [Thermoanaerobaculia bacterium]